MEDVIFSGSDARKPTAAAEVRLRFSGVLKSAARAARPTGRNGHADAGNGHAPATGIANGNGHGNGHAQRAHGHGRHGHHGHATPRPRS